MRLKSDLAGRVIILKQGDLEGKEFHIEDWWDRLSRVSWKWAQGNPACLGYALRIAFQKFRVPDDDEVLYGHIDGLGYLVHITELG